MRRKVRKIFMGLVLVLIFAGSAFAGVPSIIMLSTRSCSACAKMSGVLREINNQYRGRIATTNIYLDNNPDIAKKYNIRFVPTLILRDSNGKEIAVEVGYKSSEEVLKIFEKAGVNI